MSRKRHPRAKTLMNQQIRLNNGLNDLVAGVGAQTGGSVLSGYGTQIFSNNYSLLTLNRIVLTYMYTGNGIFQTAIQLPIQDAIGKGVEIESGEMDNAEIDAVYEYWEEHELWNTVLNAWTWVRLFGGGAVLFNSVQDPESPLTYRGLMGTPIEFYDLDRWQLDTNIAIFDDWESPFFAGTADGLIYLYGEPIHQSRFLRGQGKRAPHYVRRQLRGWGMSEGERMIRDLNLYLKTQDANFELIDEAKVDVYKITGLNNKLVTTGGTAAITQRVQAANELKNYVNAIVMDMQDDWAQKTMTFAGLAEVMNENRMGVAAALRMPMTKLFGLSASGFNTGESDLENYNQMVESEIRRPLKPILRKMISLTMAHIFGYVPSFQITYPSLRELDTDSEERRKDQVTNRILAFYDRGMLNSEEVMESARKEGVIQIETLAEKGLLPEQPVPPQSPSDGTPFPTTAAVSRVKNEKTYKPPKGAALAARRAIEAREKYGDKVKGGTQVGWTRARQLAKRESLSLDTVKRMSSFFARHQGNQTVAKGKEWYQDAGYIARLLWGGNAGKEWADNIAKDE